MDWLRVETTVYWAVFTSTFLLAGLWESRRPNRDWIVPSGRRWIMHFLLFASTGVLQLGIRLMTPMGASIFAREAGLGLLPRVGAPVWLAFGVALPALDLVKYGMHRLFHAVPWLWPVHRVHHSDPDFDVSTSIRFHPVESILMQAADIGAILLLGVPPVAVLVISFAANVVNITQHANANMDERWEKLLRNWTLTARAHRIHHSDAPEDERRNFGEIFPWWDRLFGTHADQPAKGDRMRVGLPGYQTMESMGLVEMLAQPLRAARKPRE